MENTKRVYGIYEASTLGLAHRILRTAATELYNLNFGLSNGIIVSKDLSLISFHDLSVPDQDRMSCALKVNSWLYELSLNSSGLEELMTYVGPYMGTLAWVIAQSSSSLIPTTVVEFMPTLVERDRTGRKDQRSNRPYIS
jgi:hypothetical protein